MTLRDWLEVLLPVIVLSPFVSYLGIWITLVIILPGGFI